MESRLNEIVKNSALLLPLLLMLMITHTSCKKYLDKKPSESLAVPSTLNDLQLVLDDQIKMNSSPGYIELVADNYYVTDVSWSSANTNQRLNYIWDKEAAITVDHYVWTNPYAAVFEVNFVLDLLPKIEAGKSDQDKFNIIKGSALFYRGFQFYQLAQLFCKPYSPSAATDPGIVLKLNSNVSDRYTRSSVQQTYEQIISDLKEAVLLLPNSTAFKTRPNKVAAYGSLARVYLSMRDYAHAALYADSALALYSSLLDYNSLVPAASLPDTYMNNPEVLFLHSAGADLLSPPRPIVDSALYQSYNNNDLRKTVFFGSNSNNTYFWKGSYYSTAQYFSTFCGIATDELYLIRSECRARTGDLTGALNDLNLLLQKRWKTGSFTNVTAATAAEALAIILAERRKELLFRGLRWTDLRRFNLENANISLRRVINGTSYLLPPNDARWVLSIPEIEINRSGIAQNVR